MNILWITMESVLPANTGGRQGIYKRLEYVAKFENIYLFYPYDREDEKKYADELSSVCREVHYYFRPQNKKHALLNLWRFPYTIGTRHMKAMKNEIQRCIEKNNIDVINVDLPHMCVNLLGLKSDIPIVLNEHNIEWKVYRRIAKSQKDLIKKLAYFVDSFRIKSFEKKILKKLNIKLITFVSDKDMSEMQSLNMCNNTECCLIPVGADRHNIQTDPGEHKNIVFVGKMSYAPNIEAVKWFLKNVFPTIKTKYSNAKFYIVGKDPVQDIRCLASESVVVTGTVESVEEYYQIADLVVLPLLNGGGVKVKLLEAISYNRPVVSTSVGVEGTLYADGKTVYTADHPSDFSEFCLSALSDSEDSQKRVKAAYEIFDSNYTWEFIGKNYIEKLKSIL